ncbi:MAG: hypothetical protein NT169_23685 [Chloroflexi bacterium]|nr:hypothetical protein [Chloroflexota bacterium]
MMTSSTPGWQIVPYEGDSPFKKVRVRDDTRIQTVARHLLAHECVALLGPPLSEKTAVLRDVADVLAATGRYRPLYVDLWQTRSDDDATFFTSLAVQIAQTLGDESIAVLERVPTPRAFQNFLLACANVSHRHLALLVDHLQALPPDLIHSLLLALRSAYMERDADAPAQLVAVVTGSMNLVGLSTGPTSPFNIARPVVALPLTPEQTVALAQATIEAHGYGVSPKALERIVAWAGGDRYLVARLCAWSAEMAQGYRRPVVTQTVVERVADCLWLADQELPPIREAIRMIEEDPDTMLDVLHLLDHGGLPRTRSRQAITRTGTDRLQLSGAAVLAEGVYSLKNQAYRHALARHFTTERVAHVLRIAGRWNEAIEYLAPRLEADSKSQIANRRVRSLLSAISRQLSAISQFPAPNSRLPTSHLHHPIPNIQYLIPNLPQPARGRNCSKPSSSLSTRPIRSKRRAKSWRAGCGSASATPTCASIWRTRRRGGWS